MGTKLCSWKLVFCPQNSAMITKTVIQETLPIGLRKDDKDPVWGETEGDPKLISP